MDTVNYKAKPFAIILIGPPATGKTTYSKALYAQCPDLVIVSLDAQREMLVKEKRLPSRRLVTDNPELREIADKNFYLAIRTAINSGKNIVIDASHTDAKSRKTTLQNIPDIYTKIALVFMVPDVHTLYQRSLGRDINFIREGKTPALIPYRITHKRHTDYTVPTLKEGFDVIQSPDASLLDSASPSLKR